VKVHSLHAALFGGLMALALPWDARADGGTEAANAPNAQGAPNPGAAKDLFERGRDLRARGDCAGALPFFQKAYAVYAPGLGSLRNIAVCQEALGHFASARDAWAELKRAVGASTESKYAGWSDDADHAIARLAPKVARVTIDLAVVDPGGEPASTDGVDVTIDGQALTKDRVGDPIDRDPGTFVVRAAGAGLLAPDEQTVVLAAGESKHVPLRVTLAAAPPPRSPGAEPSAAVGEREEHGHHGSTARTGAWVALGIGVAGVAGAVASAVVRQSALSDVNANCGGNLAACDASKQSTVTSEMNRGRTASTLLTVFGAVGIVGIGTGITLFTISRPQAQAALTLSPTGVGAVGTF
jgi:hypothetical protein